MRQSGRSNTLTGVKKLGILIALVLLISAMAVWQGEEIRKQKQVLGWKLESERIAQEITYWEKTVSESPTYRDGYIQLILLNLNLGKTKEAGEWMSKVKEIDPNWEVPTSLEQLVSRPE